MTSNTQDEKPMKIAVKIHTDPQGTVVALCDEDLIGQVIVEDNRQLDCSSPFYEGDLLTEDEAAEEIIKGKIINVVGKHALAVVRKKHNVAEEDLLVVSGVPHVQVAIESEQ